MLHCAIYVLVTLCFFLFEQFMIDCSQSVFKLETACGLLSGKGSETIVIRFAPTNPINYYRRLTCLVQNQVTLSTEFSLTFFDWTYWWFIKGTGIGRNGFQLWKLDTVWENFDYYMFPGNCPPTPPLSQQFALSEK